MIKILFVCTGNTCRSPMAAALTTAQAQEQRLKVEVLSAGLAADDSSPASPGAIKAMTGIADLSEHRSLPLSGELVDWADLIAVMTNAQRKLLLEGWPQAQAKTYTLAALITEDCTQDVQDPFGQSQDVYNQTRDQVQAMVLKILPNLKQLSGRFADDNSTGQ